MRILIPARSNKRIPLQPQGSGTFSKKTTKVVNLQTIAITGHTSGIGKSLFTHFQKKGSIVSGFSRSNGYDLSNPAHLMAAAQKINSHDIFINNAHVGWAQIDLLYLVFEHWKSQPKHIINISSNSSDGIKNYVHSYAVQKAALDKANEQLNAIKEAKCRVTNLRPGWVDTERINQLNIHEPKISMQEIADLVEWIIELPKTLHISSMSMTARER